MRLFQFSLRDQASNWLKCLPVGSIATWEDLTTRFLAQFFPPGRTAKLRNDILMFQQHHGEYLSEAWTLQLLMEAHLALTQPTQVNKVTTPCEVCSGPHDTQYCMEDPKQAFVEYTSSRTDEVGGKKFTLNQGPRNFNDATNAWKEKPNLKWARTQIFTSPQNRSFSVHSSNYQLKLEKAFFDFDSHQEKRLSYLRTQLEQQQDDMIGKINLLWKDSHQEKRLFILPCPFIWLIPLKIFHMHLMYS
ncbi:MAK10-like protein [Tanacetum coccineum]